MTSPAFGTGRRKRRKPFLLYWWTRSSFRGSGRPMIRIASNGHLWTHMLQAIQVSSLIVAFPVSLSSQMTSVPVRCGGQNVMHSRLQRFGWQRSLKTTAIRLEGFGLKAGYLNVRWGAFGPPRWRTTKGPTIWAPQKALYTKKYNVKKAPKVSGPP